MRKPKRSTGNTRQKQGGLRPFIYLILTVVLIIFLFYLLEMQKKPVPPEKPVAKPSVEAPARPGKAPEKPVPPEKPELPGKPVKPVSPLPVQKGYTSPPVPVPPYVQPMPAGEGTIAIIIDDMGTSVGEVRELMDIGVPLTFSVIPGLRDAKGVAEAAHARGYDVMLHIPMEPRDYPSRRLEVNGLLLEYPDEEIIKRMRGFIEMVPHAVGANNHMGSRFTEDGEKMRVVLGILKSKRMFFVDSMTTPKSVGLSRAREMGLMATARSAPFLDNSEDVADIKTQLGALERLARTKGSAVGICHPHRATMRALAEELPMMRRRGIRFVYVSGLVR